MPTNLRTAAVARWVGRGNGPSRVTGASACTAAGDCFFFGNQFHYPLHGEKARFGLKAAARPVAGDCYKSNYPHNSRCSEDKHCTAGISHSTTNGATAHFPCQIRISSAKGGPGRDRMRKSSVTDAFRLTHGQTNSCTGSDVADMAVYGTLTLWPSYGRKVQEGEAASVGRRQSAQTYWQQNDAQVATGPHNQLPWGIWRAAEALPSRQWSFYWDFLLTGLPPEGKNNNGMTCTRISPRRSHVRIEYGIGIGPGEPCGRPIGIYALRASLPGNHGYAAARQGWGTTVHRLSASELLVRGSVLE
jgi:hypothetical protein